MRACLRITVAISVSLSRKPVTIRKISPVLFSIMLKATLCVKKLRYEGVKDVELFKKFKVNHHRLLANSLKPPQEVPKHTPIFIAGIPLSGTTLVEQIVSSHPLVAGAGELPFIAKFGGQLTTSENSLDVGALKSFRDLYCNALQNHSSGKPFVTDKTPQNFKFLGLIAAALPEAKVV